MRVYALNAAAAKIGSHALQAMAPCYEKFCGNPSSLHTIGREAADVPEDSFHMNGIAYGKNQFSDCASCAH